MLDDIVIKNLRGIESGELKGLGALTIVVGKNGQGKSTVLEAMALLAGAPDVRALHGVAVRRGFHGGSSFDYLFPARKHHSPGVGSEAQIEIRARVFDDLAFPPNERVTGEVVVTATANQTFDQTSRSEATAIGMTPLRQLSMQLGGVLSGSSKAIVGEDGALSIPTLLNVARRKTMQTCVILDHRLDQLSIESQVSNATTEGYLELPLEFIRGVVPDARDIRLVVHQSRVLAMLYFGGGRVALPVNAMGDGIRRLINVAMTTLGGPPGLVLVEEPENFLHPSARLLCARLLWAAVDRGEQVMVSTHSLDLIDDLLETAKDRIERVAVFRCRLNEGSLDAIRLSGDDARAARDTLGEDLRA